MARRFIDGKISEQIIISGRVGSTELYTTNAPYKIPFNQFWTQKGVTYDSANRRFYITVSGIYRILFNPFSRSDATNGPTRVLLGINNDAPNRAASEQYGHAYQNTGDYATSCICSTVELNAGDYIVFYLEDGVLYNRNADRFNDFSIELVK